MNNDGMIRPRHGVNLPDANAVPGLGQRQMNQNAFNQPGMGNGQQQMQQQMSAADVIRNTLSNAMGSLGAGQAASGGGGGFNWGTGSASFYEDDAIRGLKANNAQDPDSITYYIERIAKPMELFIQSIFHRAGPLFEEYKKAKEAFRFNEMQIRCALRSAFIDDVNKQHDFTRIVAFYGAPFFGKILISLLQSNPQQDQLTTRDYLTAAGVAVRNVLFFELVNWLMRSPSGKQYALRVPQDILAKFAHLENFKEAAFAAYDTFGQQSPYASLEFKRPESTRTDYAMLYGPSTDYVHQPFDSSSRNGDMSGDFAQDEIMEMVQRNAAARRGEYRPPNRQATTHMRGDVVKDWNTVRSDFNNLTPANREEFNLSRFFHAIGKPNHYFIPDSDWRTIQIAFKKHAEQRQEETLLPGCFRVVILDFNGDTGWFSTVVRSNKLDMQTVLTDPTKLLPLLENPEHDDTWKLKTVSSSAVVKPDSLHVEVETCRKLEKATPFIAIKEAIVTGSSKDLEATVITVNNRLTENFKKENATGFDATVWNTYTCATAADKTRLYNDLPFLFKDGGVVEQPSFYQACRSMAQFFHENIVDNALFRFVDAHLTDKVNNWLINSCGYSPIPGRGHLSVTSIISDYAELNEYLKHHDPQLSFFMHQTDKDHELLNELKMFSAVNTFQEPDEGAIAQLKTEVDLVVDRRLFIASLNKRAGPLYINANEPIVIKRSKFPEYFEIIEKGFEATMPEDVSFDAVTKIIRFNDTDNMWVFNYSALDANAATLRKVSNTKELCLLAFC